MVIFFVNIIIIRKIKQNRALLAMETELHRKFYTLFTGFTEKVSRTAEFAVLPIVRLITENVSDKIVEVRTDAVSVVTAARNLIPDMVNTICVVDIMIAFRL